MNEVLLAFLVCQLSYLTVDEKCKWQLTHQQQLAAMIYAIIFNAGIYSQQDSGHWFYTEMGKKTLISKIFLQNNSEKKCSGIWDE